MERQDSRRAGNGTGADRRVTVELPGEARLTDRQLLEEAIRFVRRVEPLLEHPIAKAFLRRSD